ncbi:hypothetical protein WICPIJ_001046 [Wickerhamomyces pijperi]|uniref:Uncharacterized protein n=1 Tax=Wickerhamomyces pijperi TaxID=599730 RepID=A0A9P8QEY2_WICPI|nr:hypothetical protein WICPIJ_001046 [Wickerhamomyces pijperi]
MYARTFSTTARQLINSTAKSNTVLLTKTINPSSARLQVGNSFESFKEYRKSAIQHGPLKKNSKLFATAAAAAPSDNQNNWLNEKARQTAY